MTQAVLLRLARHRSRLIVRGRDDDHAEGLGAHVAYLQYLLQKQSAPTETERFERPYCDYLQAR